MFSVGLNLYNKFNLVDAPCPVCGVELQGLKNKQNQCPKYVRLEEALLMLVAFLLNPANVLLGFLVHFPVADQQIWCESPIMSFHSHRRSSVFGVNSDGAVVVGGGNGGGDDGDGHDGGRVGASGVGGDTMIAIDRSRALGLNMLAIAYVSHEYARTRTCFTLRGTSFEYNVQQDLTLS